MQGGLGSERPLDWLPHDQDDYALTSNPFRAYVAGELKADAAIAKELRKAKTG